MEIEESRDDKDEESLVVEEPEDEFSCLPKEWTYTNPVEVIEVGITEHVIADKVTEQSAMDTVEIFQEDTEKSEQATKEVQPDKGSGEDLQMDIERDDQVTKKVDTSKENHAPAVKKRNQKWGPVIPERKSKRNMKDGMTMLEKAQALKEKNNLEAPKGKKHIPTFSSNSLVDLACKIGLDVDRNADGESRTAQQILEVIEDRKIVFSKGCKVVDCDLRCSTGELPPECYSSVVNKPLSLSSSSLQGVVSNVLGYVGTEDVG
jgi:hypothetical protein